MQVFEALIWLLHLEAIMPYLIWSRLPLLKSLFLIISKCSASMNIRIEKAASEFRTRHGFTNLDPIRLKSLLLKLNVITIFKPLSENLSGMAVKEGDYRFMLINSRHSIGRQHFSICHELYHLYIQKDFIPHHRSAGLFDKKTEHEYKADLFAAYLLMPKDGIINLIPECELDKD